jgi:hypothetical protein
MARIGINPARGKSSTYRPARVTLGVLTYIPDLSGYFAERLQILKLVLASLRAHTTLPYDLVIFDNNSCPQVVEYLSQQQRAGNIDYLIRSRENIGKIGALRILFEAAPGEIIAYNDDDILFYPGWLEAHLEILSRFPRVGMVSGVPVRNAARHARRSLEALIDQGAPGLTSAWERRIPAEWEIDWALSTGRDPGQHLAETSEQMDLVLRSQATGGDQADVHSACEAIGSANHFQFVAPKHVITQALPEAWSGKLMGHMIELDEAVDELGYLRLSTTERYTRHLGNRLSPEILAEAVSMGLMKDASGELIPGHPAGQGHQPRMRHWSLRIPGMRRLYLAIYRRLFDLLYR